MPDHESASAQHQIELQCHVADRTQSHDRADDLAIQPMQPGQSIDS